MKTMFIPHKSTGFYDICNPQHIFFENAVTFSTAHIHMGSKFPTWRETPGLGLANHGGMTT
jgi:hypothetical protein